MTSPKAKHPHHAIWCFFFQLKVACLFLKMIQQLLTSCSSSSRHFYPSLFLSFNSVFEFAVQIENVTNPFQISGFGGLEVARWPLVPKFAGSHPAEAVGFLEQKNPQHAVLRRGSKAVGPMS
jgi:hypothetical protein